MGNTPLAFPIVRPRALGLSPGWGELGREPTHTPLLSFPPRGWAAAGWMLLRGFA